MNRIQCATGIGFTVRHAPNYATTTPFPRYTHTIRPTAAIGLDLEPLAISVHVDNISLFLQDNSASTKDFFAQFDRQFSQEYRNRRAGLIIALGYHNSGHIALARQLANHAIDLLQSRYASVFSNIVEKTFWWDPDVNHPVGTIDFEIYFFTDNP